MTTPNALSPTPGVTSSWHPTYEYRVNTAHSTSTETVYSLWHVNNGIFVGGANATHGIKVVHSSNQWFDYGTDIPNNDPLTVNGLNIELYDTSTTPHTLLYSFIKPTTASWIPAGGGSGSGGSGVYPPPRTSHWFGVVLSVISWGLSTYNIYLTATGSTNYLGEGTSAFELMSGDKANEVSASIEVGAQNNSGANVSPGDELYVTMDEDHADDGVNPNMTITAEEDSNGAIQNPSNTITNPVVAGTSGTVVDLHIVTVKPPQGTFTIKIKNPDPQLADNSVGSIVMPRRRRSGNFW